MSHTPVNVARLCLVALCLVFPTGCTSALTATYLRDAVWDLADQAPDQAPEAGPDRDAAPPSAAAGTDSDVADDIAADRADAERRQAAIEEAVERLSHIGTLDAAAQATLVETLQATQQEDWPVVIEAFAATLAETKAPPSMHVVAKAASEPEPPPSGPVAETVTAAPEPPTAAEAVAAEPEPPATPASAPAVEPSAAVAPVAAPEPGPVPAPAATPFVVANACFASRVEAWGVVERFAEDRFRPGQEVIVYFELEGLSSGGSPAGFTTCIDTVLRLVAEDGRELRAWRFEPIAETCAAVRRDYFARYVVRLPDEAAPGGCRLELAVTDTLAGRTADATLPCRIE